MQSTAQRRMEQ
jgi:hypothetical protein